MKKFNEKQSGIISSSELKTASGKILYWSMWFMLVITAVISVVPALWTILTAFKDTKEIYSEFAFFPKDMSWGRFIGRITESWKSLQLGESFLNTVFLSLGDLAFSVLICAFGGYVLSKIKPSGTKLIFTLVVWTMMMPGQIRMVPNYITYLHFPFAMDFGAGVSLLDTFWPMWFERAANPFAVLLFKNAFDGLSTSYVEAGKLDGCTNYGIFFKIMLPLVTPIIIYQSISVLSIAWSDFFTPLLVLDRKTVVPLSIYRLQQVSDLKMNTYFMALVFASVPPFIIFLFFQKRILGGVNVGGVKG